MKSKLFFVVTALSVLNALAQPNIEWQKSLGGTNADVARSITQTTDGGYMVAGYTTSINGDVSENNGGRDVWIVKLNSSGVMEWEKSYGGTGSEEAYEIQQTTGGGYIITGMSDSNNFFGSGFGNDDILVIKTDSNGSVEWGKRFGTISSERGHSVKQTTDGNYIVTGFIGGGGTWVAKLDSSGNLYTNWSNVTFGGSQAYAVEETSDGGFVIAGYSVNGTNNIDVRVFKLNATSDIAWDYNFGGTNADYAYSIKQTIDGGFIVAGMTESNNGDVINNYGNQDFWVLKLNASGGLEWQSTYGGSQNDFANKIQQTNDGGYIVVGQTNSDDNDVSGNPGSNIYDYWVVKLNSTGQLQWQSCLGGSANDFGNAIQQTTDGGFIVAGRSASNNYDVSGNHGNYDFWLVKLESETLGVNPNFMNEAISIYPNPTTNKIYINTNLNVISLTLYDAIGKLIINQKTCNELNVEHLKQGLYLLKIESSKDDIFKKIIIN